jgi:hypothetical protein
MTQDVARLKKFFDSTVERNKGLETELAAARRIIWAMVKSNDGEIIVPDVIMAQAEDPGMIISCVDDRKNLQCIFKSNSGEKEEEKGLIILPGK